MSHQYTTRFGIGQLVPIDGHRDMAVRVVRVHILPSGTEYLCAWVNDGHNVQDVIDELRLEPAS